MRGAVVRLLVFVVELTGCFGAAAALPAQTKYPGADSVMPLAITRGRATEVEVRFNGQVKTAYEALVGDTVVGTILDDVKATVVERSGERKIPDDHAVVRLEPSPDARLGPRDLRLVTKDAITTLCRFYVTDLPSLLETDSHAKPEEAQAIELPCVVNGRIQAAVETDWYRFEAKKGDRVNFEVLGTRLHETIHKIGRFTPHFDSYLSIRDAAGRELAAADDHYFADSFLSFVAPADGEYHVVVREANYKGHVSYTYALVATRGPIATLTFPLAARPGQASEVALLGPGMGDGDRATVTLDPGAVPGYPTLVRPRRPGGQEERELLVLPSELPVVLESEDPGASTNDDPTEAQTVSLPAGVAGRLGRADDVDCFGFEARKGLTYRIEVFARRLFSAIDSELEVVDESGRVLGSGDDTSDFVGRRSRDSLLDWKAPRDGRFVVRLRDLHGRGARDFVYHIECTEAEPDYELTFDPELAMVGPGNRTPVYVRAHRRYGFDAPIDLAVEGLPEGVEAFAPPIRSGMTDACVVFSVSKDAPPGGANFRIRGEAGVESAGGEARRIVREALPLVEIYQAQRVIGRTAGIAVTEASDIAVTTTAHEVVLKPGESKVIPIKLIRGASYKSGSVSLWGLWTFGNRVFGNSLPPGVTVDEKKSSLGIIGENVDGAVALTAAADAKPISKVPTVVIGLIPIEFSVFVPFCTRPILVSVANKDGTLASAKE